MQKIDTWYKAEGYCPIEDFELASYLLFEAGVATLEELDPKAEGRTDFCFYTGDKAERDRIVAEFPQYHFTLSDEPAPFPRTCGCVRPGWNSLPTTRRP